MSMDSALLAAYYATHYQVRYAEGEFTLHIGQASAALEKLLQARGYQEAVFITACNPHSQLCSAKENQAAQQRLYQVLSQYHTCTILPGKGIDPQEQWPGEDSYLVLGLNLEAAKAIGRQFAQNALVWIGLSTPAQLILL